MSKQQCKQCQIMVRVWIQDRSLWIIGWNIRHDWDLKPIFAKVMNHSTEEREPSEQQHGHGAENHLITSPNLQFESKSSIRREYVATSTEFLTKCRKPSQNRKLRDSIDGIVNWIIHNCLFFVTSRDPVNCATLLTNALSGPKPREKQKLQRHDQESMPNEQINHLHNNASTRLWRTHSKWQ